MHGPKRGVALRVGQLLGAVDISAGIGASGAHHDPSAISGSSEPLRINHNVVLPLDHRSIGAELDKVRVAIKDADDGNPVAEEGCGGRRDHGIGRRRGTAGEEDRHATDRSAVVRALGLRGHGNSKSLIGGERESMKIIPENPLLRIWLPNRSQDRTSMASPDGCGATAGR